MVLGGIKTGTELVVDSVRVFRRYPRLVVPLLGIWVVIAGLVIWNRFFRGPIDGFTTILLLAFGLIFVQAFLLAFACSMLLEMVEQVETGGDLSLATAFVDTVRENVAAMVPLILVWSVVWFVLSVIEALFEDDSSDGEYSAENAARALAGGNGSLLSAGIDALKKGIRMFVFLILPAIAWEDRGFVGATRRGYGIFKNNVSAFVTGFSLTYLLAGVLFVPVALIFWLADQGLIQLSATQWYLVIGYVGIAWSLSIYLEQMFTADLFLWHKEWEQAVAAAQRDGEAPPSMRDVPRPTLLDDVDSLDERKLPGGGAAPLVADSPADSETQ